MGLDLGTKGGGAVWLGWVGSEVVLVVCVLGAYLGEVLGARLAAGKAGTILPFLLVFLVWVSISYVAPIVYR